MEEVESLRYFATRQVALCMFQKQVRWRKLTDVARTLKDELALLRLPLRAKKTLHEAIGQLLREMQRWAEKHAEMFIERSKKELKKGRAQRSEHLRIFHPCVIWKDGLYEIDDIATAKNIMATECKDWPQMRWQFASCYAMQDHVTDDWKYDKYRRATFKKTLSEHPVYDFWLTLIDSSWEVMFETERRTPNQKMSLCFCFAITHGYYQLVRFLWERIGEGHREYIGLLQWRSFCFRCRDRDTMRFLCTKLCEVNPQTVARITWHTFFDAFYKSINSEQNEKVNEEKNKHKVEFLLLNCCETLRRRLLGMENFRVVSDAFRYNKGDTFALFLEYLTPEQLRSAREVLDRIHDRNQTPQGEKMKRMAMRRQMTIT